MVTDLLAALAFTGWLLALLDPRRRWARALRLDEESLPPVAATDRVVAIVPARDEAEALPAALPSLLSQTHERFHVVLVDDRSSDRTGAVARSLAETAGRSDRLTVVDGIPQPAGWSGKVNAQDRALSALRDNASGRAEWLLLTDADIRHPPDSVERLLAKARDGDFDLVSIMARLRAETFWERLLVPPFVFFFHLLYPFARVNANRGRLAAAAGGCILVRRQLFEEAGGFEAIRGEIIDDVAVAKLVKSRGGRLWLGFHPGVESIRPYTRLAEIWRMVARTAFVQLRRSYALLALTCLLMLVFLIAPPGLTVGCFATGQATAGALALAAWLVPAGMLLPFTLYHRVPGFYALLLPLASLLYLLMTLSSGWNQLRGRGPEWKGRSYGSA